MAQSLAPMAMTQAQQEAELQRLRLILAKVAPRLTADRCRHESVTDAALWVFDGESQIGSITREGAAWRCSAMHRGTGISCRWVGSLEEAIAHVLEMTRRSVAA